MLLMRKREREIVREIDRERWREIEMGREKDVYVEIRNCRYRLYEGYEDFLGNNGM